MKNGKIEPIKPFYKLQQNQLNFYGSKKTYNNYIKKINKELKRKNIDITKLNVNIISDIQEKFQLKFNIDNDIFNKSLTKMAIEFAIHSNISIKYLKHLIDSKNKDIIKTMIIPYIPQTNFEEAIEKTRSYDSNYPNHNLVLFTENTEEKTMLICFIDILSTFQYFVILSENYTGEEIFIPYCQRILIGEKNKYSVDKNIINSKHILPDIYELKSRQPSLNIENLSNNKLTKALETYLSQGIQSEINYEAYLSNLFNNISLPLAQLMTNSKSLNEMTNKKIVNKLKGYEESFYFNCLFQMRQYYFTYSDKSDIILEKKFRRISISNNIVKSIFDTLIPICTKGDNEIINKYCSEKFNDLIKFNNEEFIKNKSKTK